MTFIIEEMAKAAKESIEDHQDETEKYLGCGWKTKEYRVGYKNGFYAGAAWAAEQIAKEKKQ